MSWNVSMIGKPENIKAALEKYSESLSGVSRQEYDDAKPHLIGLVDQNVSGSLIKVNASGHATFVDGVKKHGSCSAAVEPFYANMV